MAGRASRVARVPAGSPGRLPVGREAELAALGDAFRRVFRALNRLRGRDTHLAGTELSHAQFQLLVELEERGEAAVGELAAAAQLAPGTVTRMLDGLAGAGHVQRVGSPADRRIVLARLTARGRAQIAAKRAAWQARWEQALAGVGSAELEAATAVLERLAAMFQEASAGGAQPGENGSANSAPTRRKPV
jgi:DNA-binding MarR family transcriptional regulator